MNKTAAYQALQDLRQQISRRVDDGSIGADEVAQILASGRDIATQAGLDPTAIEDWLQRAQGGVSTQSIPGLGTSQADALNAFNASELPDVGVSFDQYLKRMGSTAGDGFISEPTNSVDWGLGDNSGLLANALKFAQLAAAGYGLGTGLESLLGNGAGALGDVATGVDSLADFNGLQVGDYTDLGGILGSGGEIASAMGNGIAPVSDGMQLFDPLAEANGLQVGEYADLGGTMNVPAETGAFDQFGSINSPAGTGMPGTVQQVMGGGATAGAGGALTTALNKALGLNLTDTDTALLGKLAGAGIGLLGAGQTGSAMSSLADKYLNLGAPARARLEQSYADPGSYLAGPDMQAFLGEASKQQANALSSRFGNPALSPNANKELLGSVANMASQGIYNYRNQLAAQGGLGVAPAAQFDASAATASTATPWNIAASVVGDVTNPQKSIIDQMRELARLGGSSWMMAG